MFTVAGSSSSGFSGDGGPATLAKLNRPASIALDALGNLVIADTGNHRIRTVANGTISTIAGNGVAGFSGDGGPATSANLRSPRGVVIDAGGNLYFSDGGNHRVRKLAAGVLSTVAGAGAQGFAGDGGPATAAALSSPMEVSIDPAGDLVIADYGNGRIRKVLVAAETVPNAPLMGGASAGNAQATVQFSPAASGGNPVGYTVTSSPAGGVDANAGSPALAHVVTGLSNGTSYTFTVTASNSAGTSNSVRGIQRRRSDGADAFGRKCIGGRGQRRDQAGQLCHQPGFGVGFSGLLRCRRGTRNRRTRIGFHGERRDWAEHPRRSDQRDVHGHCDWRLRTGGQRHSP